MIIRIKNIKPLENYQLYIEFDDNRRVEYDMRDDITTLPQYYKLATESGLWNHAQLDESRTIVFWNEDIDLPSDILYEYGKELAPST